MKHIFTKYKLSLVKESAKKYELNNKMTSPNEVYKVLKNVLKLNEEAEEVLILLTLDTKYKISGIFEVSRGSLNSSLIHPREIFKRAMLTNAGAIILCHNHPSGVTDPSIEDIKATNRIKECGKVLGIELLDHLIVGNGFCSLKDKSVI